MIKFITKELDTEKFLKQRIIICNTTTTILSRIRGKNKYPSVINKKL